MDAMKEALKRKMASYSPGDNVPDSDDHADGADGADKPAMEVDIAIAHKGGKGAKDAKAKSASDKDAHDDTAPSLDSDPDSADDKASDANSSLTDSDSDSLGLKGPPAAGEGGADHMAILKGIADKGHMGRGASSLGERAADGAKAKIAMMNKARGSKA